MDYVDGGGHVGYTGDGAIEEIEIMDSVPIVDCCLDGLSDALGDGSGDDLGDDLGDWKKLVTMVLRAVVGMELLWDFI